MQIADLREEAASRAQRDHRCAPAIRRACSSCRCSRGDDIVGVLVVRRKAPGAFAQNTVDLLKTFAAQSVLAIQNARLFREIDDKSRQLEVASQHKSQFLANMSHELRTPLNAILGYTELILDNIYGETPEKMREVLERVQTNGKHLLGLINDVLDLSKIEAGQLTLVARRLLARGCGADRLRRGRVAGERKEARASHDDRRRICRSAHGDERRLAQVLLNLVGNAIKFTDNGEVAIKAIARRRRVHGRGARHRAGHCRRRSGQDLRGVPAGRQLCRPSRRAAPGSGSRSPSASSRCTAAASGSNSELGKGSTFAFTLPVNAGRKARAP